MTARAISPAVIPQTLIPYNRAEALTVREAAFIARKSTGTIRQWASIHFLGRRVGGGDWVVSHPALLMHLDGDAATLRAYLSGDRESEAVRAYFLRSEQEKTFKSHKSLRIDI